MIIWRLGPLDQDPSRWFPVYCKNQVFTLCLILKSNYLSGRLYHKRFVILTDWRLVVSKAFLPTLSLGPRWINPDQITFASVRTVSPPAHLPDIWFPLKFIGLLAEPTWSIWGTMDFLLLTLWFSPLILDLGLLQTTEYKEWGHTNTNECHTHTNITPVG